MRLLGKDSGYWYVSHMSKGLLRITVIVAAVCLGHKPALGEPWLPPGDILIRSDLQLLADVGMLQVPISTWPLSLANIAVALEDADSTEANPMAVQALQRVRIRLRDESRVNNVRIRSSIRGSSEQYMEVLCINLNLT